VCASVRRLRRGVSCFVDRDYIHFVHSHTFGILICNANGAGHMNGDTRVWFFILLISRTLIFWRRCWPCKWRRRPPRAQLLSFFCMLLLSMTILCALIFCRRCWPCKWRRRRPRAQLPHKRRAACLGWWQGLCTPSGCRGVYICGQ